MIRCPKEVQERCPYSLLCEPECKVEETSDCAAYIRAVISGTVEVRPVEVDPVEAAYLQQEREAIQQETLPDFMRKYVVYRINEGRLTMAKMYDMETVNRTMTVAASFVASGGTEREKYILNTFAAMKPVEAEPVKHARWVPVLKNLFKVKHYRCSACGCKEKENGWAYCHCGARMDAKEAEV